MTCQRRPINRGSRIILSQYSNGGDESGTLPRYEVHRWDNTLKGIRCCCCCSNQMPEISNKDIIVYLILDAINTTVYCQKEISSISSAIHSTGIIISPPAATNQDSDQITKTFPVSSPSSFVYQRLSRELPRIYYSNECFPFERGDGCLLKFNKSVDNRCYVNFDFECGNV